MNRHEYTHLHQLLNDLGIVFLIGLLNGFGWRSESNKNTLLRESAALEMVERIRSLLGSRIGYKHAERPFTLQRPIERLEGMILLQIFLDLLGRPFGVNVLQQNHSFLLARTLLVLLPLNILLHGILLPLILIHKAQEDELLGILRSISCNVQTRS